MAVTSGSVCVRRQGVSTLAPAGAVLTNSGGLHHVIVFTASATAFFVAGADYCTFFGNGTLSGNNVIGYVVHTFSINNRSGYINWANTTGTATLEANIQNVKGAGAAGSASYLGHDWAANTGTATLNVNVQNVLGAGASGVASYLGIAWANSTGTATLNANIQNVRGVGAGGSGGFLGLDWASTTNTATINANIQNVQNAGVRPLISGRMDANTQVIANAAIGSATFAASAVDAAALATDGANEFADALLARDIQGGASSTDRDVTNTLRAIRNRTVITSTGQLIVYQEDDSTTAWTAVTTTGTAVSLTGVDPA